jgi:DNA excision repair protein ERCC-4
MSGRSSSRLQRNTGDDDYADQEFLTGEDNINPSSKDYYVNDPAQSLLNTHPHSQLPSYLSDAFSDLYAQDGLVVMGKGLGWLSLFSSFVRFYGDTGDFGYAATLEQESGRFKDQTSENGSIDKVQHQRKTPLIFALNLRDNERQVLLSTLSSWGTPTENQPRIITNEAGQASERAALYARGGVFIITSRILIVDLLQGTANAKDIEGMMVAHADKVVGDKSTEAFILRIFKSQRDYLDHSTAGGSDNAGGRGFIKAFTDDPSSLVSGSFAKVDKVLKSLQVQRLFLYPRFHAAVAEELERQPPTVIELHQPLSHTMKEIQNYLAASIRSCLRDLRQKCQLVDLSFLFDADGTSGDRKRKRDSFCSNNRARNSSEDWKFTIQKVMSTNFSYILSRQLEGDWHRLGRDVKQCVSDLRTLSQLFHYLIEYGELQSFGSNRSLQQL